jgi:hypothetical protein
MKEIEQSIWYFCKQGACIEMRLKQDEPYRGLYSTGAYQWEYDWLSKGSLSSEERYSLEDDIEEAEDYAYDEGEVCRDEDGYRDLWISKLKENGWLETKLSFSYKAEVCDVQI